jgi:hypothetical protein
VKKGIPILAIIVFLAIAAVATFFFLLKVQKDQINLLGNELSSLESEKIPMRFIIEKPKDGYLNVTIRFMDGTGNPGPSVAYELKGTRLYLDFIIFPYKNAYLVYPWKIFTEQISPDNGINLCKDYLQNGFPVTFSNISISTQDKNKIMEYFDLAKSSEWQKIKNSFGNALHDIQEIGSFKTSVIYKVVTRKLGGIEIMED